jgi:glycosyltransferase involved in cell wall biosynthesis
MIKEENSKEKPKVSIITITYNSERHLEKTIQSILKQTYNNIEYIIVDGGSKDKTLEIIKQYESSIDKWISEKDEGVADAMNKGAKLASGDYIIHLHSDDIFAIDQSVDILIDTVLKKKNLWVTGFYKYINSKNEIIRADSFVKIYNFRGMLMRNIIRHQTTMIPKSFFDTYQFDKSFKYAMDYLFFLQVWKKFGPPFFIQKHITHFRIDGQNLSSNIRYSMADEMRVRIFFRKKEKQYLQITFDYIIYFLRIVKLYAYHSKFYKKHAQ